MNFIRDIRQSADKIVHGPLNGSQVREVPIQDHFFLQPLPKRSVLFKFGEYGGRKCKAKSG